MKFLFDFFPIALFFVVFKFYDIYYATFAAILATLGVVIWSRLTKGYFEKMPLFTLGVVGLLGGATLVFRNEWFIKWKPTVVYWGIAVVFIGTRLFGKKKPLIQTLMGEHIQLKDLLWDRLNFSWISFFMLMGFANLYVVYTFDTETWVNFKVFGTLGITLIFILIQGAFMAYLSKNPSHTK